MRQSLEKLIAPGPLDRVAASRFRKTLRDDPDGMAGVLVDTLQDYRGDYTAGVFYALGGLVEAMVLSGKGRVDNPERVSDVLARLQHMESRRAYQILAGGRFMQLGDRSQAYRRFMNAVALPDEHGWFSQHRGAQNIRPYGAPEWFAPAARHRDIQPAISWRLEPKRRSHGVTVVLGGDCKYFCSLSQPLLRVLADLESLSPVHFHVVGWNEECDATTTALTAIYPNVSISTEDYPHSSDYTYFATVRFVRAIELLNALGPLYISDMDNTFVLKPEEAVDHFSKFDVGFRYNGWETWFPWLAPNAGSVYINNSPKGLHVAELMTNYFDHRFMPNAGNNWYFDQLLLNELQHHAKARFFNLARGIRISGARPAHETKFLKKARSA